MSRRRAPSRIAQRIEALAEARAQHIVEAKERLKHEREERVAELADAHAAYESRRIRKLEALDDASPGPSWATFGVVIVAIMSVAGVIIYFLRKQQPVAPLPVPAALGAPQPMLQPAPQVFVINAGQPAAALPAPVAHVPAPVSVPSPAVQASRWLPDHRYGDDERS